MKVEFFTDHFLQVDFTFSETFDILSFNHLTKI